MTTMQVKQQIDAMSDEDHFLAAAYLEHLSNEREKRAGGHFVKYLHPDPISALTAITRTGGASFRPGLNAYSFLEQLNANLADAGKGIDLFGVCNFCAQHDIEAVDLTGYFSPSYPKAPADSFINRMKRDTHDRGITISGTGVKKDFATADKAVRAEGVEKWDIPQTEMYDEPFHVPAPDAVVFEEKWDQGEHFRSGCVWTVGTGRVFYFRPGHETYPVFQQAEPLRVVENAVRWLSRK
jgi:hypothetical protein